MYEIILVPLDGSELAQIALPYAEKVAGRLGSQITLLYVSGTTEDKFHNMHQFYLQKMVENTRLEAERYLDNPESKTAKVEAAILLGDPAEEIVDFAEKGDIGLIVMSTHGRSGIKRWAMGSVADKVLRATNKPVALVRAKHTRPNDSQELILNRILVTLDGSKQGETVLAYIEELAFKLNTELILLQVVVPDYHIYSGGGQEYSVYSEQQLESAKALARDYLESLVVGLQQKGISAKSHVTFGTAADEIIKFADAVDAGLVAMSTHGRSGVSRWALGSVAERVLRAGNTPILLVRVPGSGTE